MVGRLRQIFWNGYGRSRWLAVCCLAAMFSVQPALAEGVDETF